jgi:taurine dioxygenase
MSFTHRSLSAPVGREVIGLDISRDIPEEVAAALRALWLDYGFLLFRGIGTSPEAQLRLSRCFGELEPHSIPIFRHPDYPELILLTNEGGPTGPIYDFSGAAIHGRIPWHADGAYLPTPNSGALLRMVRNAETGGQTGWLDLALAYEALDAATQASIERLEAVYLFRAGLEEMRFVNPGGKRLTPRRDNYPNFPPVLNPLVWTHPETGQKILNVSTLNIDHIHGMAPQESDALINKLIAHILQPQFQYVHDWQNNDMVVWDNRRTLHAALGHPADQIRIVHRTTIKGDVAMGRILEEAAA